MEPDYRFVLGQEVNAIYIDENEFYIMGQEEVHKITVIMEDGQLSSVPWFAVWKDDKIVSKFNSMYVVSVDLIQ